MSGLAPLPESDYYTRLWSAEQLIARHGAVLRYTPEAGWLVWVGTHWEIRGTETPVGFAADTVRQWYTDAASLDSRTGKEVLVKWAIRCESETVLREMCTLAAGLEGSPVRANIAQFDAQPWLISLQNGTLDLETGRLHKHRREDYLTVCLPFDYEPDAPAPVWEAFLARVQRGRPDMVPYLQRICGYSLTGLTGEKCLFFLYGVKDTGKSTFVETLQTVLGAYARKVSISILMPQRQGDLAVMPYVAELDGRRVVVASETAENKRLNEELVKDLTGQDRMEARRLFHKPFNFKPQFKIWIYGNHRPTIIGTDDSIWGRIHVVPFDERISEEERDGQLQTKLAAERAGIFAWMVQGATAWRTEGLQPPPRVQEATADYRAEQNVLGHFLAECCERDAGARVLLSELFAVYMVWARQNNERVLSAREVGKRLREGLGVHVGPGARNQTTVFDWALRPEVVNELAKVSENAREGQRNGYRGQPLDISLTSTNTRRRRDDALICSICGAPTPCDCDRLR